MEEILASIRRIIADDQDSGRTDKPAELDGSSQDANDVLDLAELDAAASSHGADLDLPEQDVSFRDNDAVGVGISKADLAPPPEAPARQDFKSGLLSPAVDNTVSQAFGLLSSTISNQSLSSTLLSSSPRTLEDLVGDLLRPLLKAWLDEHLPPLVERLVRTEIERVARGGR